MKIRVGTGPVPGVKLKRDYKRQPQWFESWNDESENENTESYSEEEEDCKECEKYLEVVDFMHVDDILQSLDLDPKKSLGKILNSKVKDMLIPIIDPSYERAFLYLVLVIHVEEFM